MSKQYTTIELFKEDMKFSAAHYTIFSATERETLHGHNFKVYAAITAGINDLGMPFDYDIYKEKLRGLCRELNQLTLIAGNSQHQQIEEAEDYTYIHFNNEKIPFLSKDIKILPVCNITVEELGRWFVERLTADKKAIETYDITKIIIKIYSGPGQCADSKWER